MRAVPAVYPGGDEVRRPALSRAVARLRRRGAEAPGPAARAHEDGRGAAPGEAARARRPEVPAGRGRRGLREDPGRRVAGRRGGRADRHARQGGRPGARRGAAEEAGLRDSLRRAGRGDRRAEDPAQGRGHGHLRPRQLAREVRAAEGPRVRARHRCDQRGRRAPARPGDRPALQGREGAHAAHPGPLQGGPRTPRRRSSAARRTRSRWRARFTPRPARPGPTSRRWRGSAARTARPSAAATSARSAAACSPRPTRRPPSP